MSPNPNDKSSSSPDLVTRRDAAAKGTIPHPVLRPNVVCRGCTGQLNHISRMRANRMLQFTVRFHRLDKTQTRLLFP